MTGARRPAFAGAKPRLRAGRRRAWRFGRAAEALCVWRLRLAGYRILARRYRTPVGEIDILARRGATLAVVEVKGRESLDAAAESLSARQRTRIRRAAGHFLAARPATAGLAVRFDVMLVRPWRPPVHLIDAWRDASD